jgi:ubiquinone/menaquinone biosynthesis C-methylase UbiE
VAYPVEVENQQVIETPEEHMEEAYLEYRQACYYALYQHALQRGLIEALSRPSTLSEIAQAMGFASDQQPTLELLLRALKRYGAVEEVENGETAYVKSEDFSSDASALDENLILKATGAKALDELLHGSNYRRGIIDSLFESKNSVATAFVNENLPLWDEFLSMPFYRYNRLRAVQRIARKSADVADAACGPGFGLQECAKGVTQTGTVHGLEISADFAAEAIKRSANLSQVRVTRTDIDANNLEFLADASLDGTMIVGAFHFLKEPEKFLSQMRRILRPNAPLCLSYVYTKGGSPDQELMDLRFFLRSPRSYPKTEDTITGLASHCGFSLESSYTMGCLQSFVFTT